MAVNNSLQSTGENQSISDFFTSDIVKKKINEVVGGKEGQRFITAITSAVNATPALLKCDRWSIFGAAMIGESLKLSPSPQLGQYYIVPYNGNAQFQIGYKGYIQLAIRSGYYEKLNVIAIKKGELIKYDPLNEELEVKLIEDDEARESTETIGYYAMFKYVSGFKKTIYWSKKKMEAHAFKYSQAYASDKNKGTAWSFWSKDFDAMAFKTLIRLLISRWGIMSIEMQDAIEKDSFKTEIDPPKNITPDANDQVIDIAKAEQEFFSNENPDAGVEQSKLKK